MTTKWVNVESIGSYFQSLPDPRHTRNRKHLLMDVVVIAICGMVCGCDGPTATHRWAAIPLLLKQIDLNNALVTIGFSVRVSQHADGRRTRCATTS